MNVRLKAICETMVLILVIEADILQPFNVTIDLTKHPNGTIISSEFFNRCSNVDSIFYYIKGSGLIIFLEIIYLNMPKSNSKRSCLNRRIEVRRDQNTTTAYCEKIISKTLISSFNHLEVVYINNGGDLSSCQYSMRYHSIRAEPCGIQAFRQNLSHPIDHETIFSTPYYPYPGLPPKTECDVRFSAQSKHRVVIEFLDIDIVYSQNCRTEQVNVFSIIAGHRYSLLARICDQRLIGERLFSDQTELYIQIKALSNQSRRGVRFSTKYVHENQLSTYLSNSEICGQSFFNQTSGTIKLRDLYKLHQLTCAWHIQAALGWKVQLRIVELRLGKSTKCSTKYLIIYNNPPRSDLQPIDRLCGSISPKIAQNIVILSEKSHMFIRLIKLPKASFSDEEYLHLEYSVVNTDFKKESCPGFQCHGGQFCSDPEKLLCYSISKYCIPWELRCDHKYSCAKYDISDEESCFLTNIKNHFVTITLTLSIFAVLSLSVLFAFCTMKQKVSKFKRDRRDPSNQPMEMGENHFSLGNLEPKYQMEKEEAINTIVCNHHQLPDINYPSASSSFCLYFHNDRSRVTFVNHHVDS